MYEVFELLILFESRTRPLHISGLLAGCLIAPLPSLKARFPGSGLVLSDDSTNNGRPQGKSLFANTKSWGYAEHKTRNSQENESSHQSEFFSRR